MPSLRDQGCGSFQGEKENTRMENQRERLGSRLGFIMLSAGCAIGCGNVWKFPWMTRQFGGGGLHNRTSKRRKACQFVTKWLPLRPET